MQHIANKAEDWGVKNRYGKFGTGHVQGAKKHKYADELIRRYQKQRTHLKTEQSYLGGHKADWGEAGSTRPDVINTNTGDVYDYKFTKRQPNKLSKA